MLEDARSAVKVLKRVVAVTLAALPAALAAAAEPPPVALAPGFRIEIIAEGLGAPRMLALDSSEALLVSMPSEGRVVALPVAPRRDQLRSAVTVASGLHLPHGLAVRGRHLWVAETGRVVRFRSEEHTSELQSPCNLVCRLLLEKKKK